MNAAMSVIVITAIVSTAVGLIGGALWNLMRSSIVKRVRVSSPESREIKRISGAVRRQSFLIEAGTDRQAMQAQAVIVLANAVKTGDQTQVTRSLDIMSASEAQYLASLTARMTRDDDIPDAESGEE